MQYTGLPRGLYMVKIIQQAPTTCTYFFSPFWKHVQRCNYLFLFPPNPPIVSNIDTEIVIFSKLNSLNTQECSPNPVLCPHTRDWAIFSLYDCCNSGRLYHCLIWSRMRYRMGHGYIIRLDLNHWMVFVNAGKWRKSLVICIPFILDKSPEYSQFHIHPRTKTWHYSMNVASFLQDRYVETQSPMWQY